MNPDFWRNKRVLITGHTGFKGSWLSMWLQYLGAQVIGYALDPNTRPNLFQVACVGNKMDSVIGDIRDLARLKETLNEAQPQIIIHLAAQPLVRYGYIDPVETYSTNIMGTVHILEAVRNTKSVKVVINITTDKCYENREWTWGYRENDRIGGRDPYSSSKACSELVSTAFRLSYFNPERYAEHGMALASARAGNVIGGGDWAGDRLVPDLLKAFENGYSAEIRQPNAIRPWQHVLEPLYGYLVLAEKLFTNGSRYAESWNFGPSINDIQPVSWMATQMAELWGNGASWKIDNQEIFHEAHILKLDISKSQHRLNWNPILGLKHSLQLVIDWHKKYANGNDMSSVCLEQIKRYQTKIAMK